jgi:hypothetical protein
MDSKKCLLLLGLAASLAMIELPMASASIFGDAKKFVKKTTRTVINVPVQAKREVTGEAAKQRRQIRAIASANLKAEVAAEARARDRDRAKQEYQQKAQIKQPPVKRTGHIPK